jgi:hypothetical protein
MSLESSQSNAHTITDAGPTVQVLIPLTGAGAPAFVSGVSQVIPTGGYPRIAVTLTSSAAGTLAVQRYLDVADTIPQGAAVTATLVAGTSATLNITDMAPCQSFTISVPSGATLSNAAVLLQSR